MAKRRGIYPFCGVHYFDKKGVGVKARPQPALPIIIYAPVGPKYRRIDVALVDTGADTSMCPSRIMGPLGFKLRSGDRIPFSGAVSKGIAWLHKARVAILTADCQGVFHSMPKVPLGVVQRRKRAPVLLGMEGFLDQFIVTIDYPNQLLILELP